MKILYTIEAHWEVGNSRPAHVYYVNDVRAGTTVADVARLAKRATRREVKSACMQAKNDGNPVAIEG